MTRHAARAPAAGRRGAAGMRAPLGTACGAPGARQGPQVQGRCGKARARAGRCMPEDAKAASRAARAQDRPRAAGPCRGPLDAIRRVRPRRVARGHRGHGDPHRIGRAARHLVLCGGWRRLGGWAAAPGRARTGSDANMPKTARASWPRARQITRPLGVTCTVQQNVPVDRAWPQVQRNLQSRTRKPWLIS